MRTCILLPFRATATFAGVRKQVAGCLPSGLSIVLLLLELPALEWPEAGLVEVGSFLDIFILDVFQSRQ